MLRIGSYREMYNVRDSVAFTDKHEAFILRQGMVGGHRNLSVSRSDVSFEAYINHNRWLIDCPCGSGCAVDLEQKNARCFGCGIIHTNVILPENRGLIEAALEKRSLITARNWVPSETVEFIEAENIVAGVK